MNQIALVMKTKVLLGISFKQLPLLFLQGSLLTSLIKSDLVVHVAILDTRTDGSELYEDLRCHITIPVMSGFHVTGSWFVWSTPVHRYAGTRKWRSFTVCCSGKDK